MCNRPPYPPLVGLLALTLTGCSGGADPLLPSIPGAPVDLNPQLSPAGSTATLGGTALRSGRREVPAALYTLRIDPAAPAAVTALHPAPRRPAQTDDVYELSIENFVKPSTFAVTAVERTATTLDLHYAVTHPFAAPADLNAPPTATNRADLGIAGRVLFLTDVPATSGNTYFGDVVANTASVTNADGYYRPAGLLDLPAFSANTFPYKVLVDETRDPRTSSATGAPLPNGGARGNYSPTDGWQRGNIGPTRDGWTGFGILHQGQTAGNTLSLGLAVLPADPFELEVAIIATYEDPRGGASGRERKGNRLPADPADVTRFVYREPHGALDLEQIRFVGESGGFLPNQVSASTLRFHVVDWDARAVETTEADLHLDLDPTHVAQGESGTPTLAVSIPGVIGDASTVIPFAAPPADDDSGFGGDPGADSGEPGDALFYNETITKTVTTGQASGTYTGLVRATDPEAGADTTSWAFPLTPDLGPAAPAPEPVVYQAFQVLMASPSTPPTLTLTTPPNVLSGTSTSITATAAGDAENDPITVEIDWDNNGSFEDTQTIPAPYTVPVTFNRPGGATYNNATLTPEMRTIPVRYTDGNGSPLPYSPALTFTLGPNRPPQLVSGGGLGLASPCLPSPATFSVTLDGTVTDPEGDPVTYTVVGTPNSGTPVTTSNIAGFPFSGPAAGPWINPPATSITFTGYANDPLHTGTGGNQLAPLSGVVGSIGISTFVRGIGGGLGELGRCMTTDSSGNIIIAGDFRSNMDFDPGPGTAMRSSAGQVDTYVVKFNAAGEFQWVTTWGGIDYDEAFSLDTDSAGNVYVAARWAQTVDFDPGPGTDSRTSAGGYDCAAMKLDPNGNRVWCSTWGGPGNDKTQGVAFASGSPHFAGGFNGTCDFDPGPGTQFRTSNGGSDDSFILKLDAAVGGYLTVVVLGNGASDYIEDIRSDPNGNLISSGVFQTTMDFDPGPGVQNRTAAGFSPFLLKLDGTALGYQWVAALSVSSSLGLTFHGLAIDAAGATYLSSEYSFGSDLDAGPGVAPPPAVAGATDAFVVKYDAAGNFVWGVTYGGTGTDIGRGVASDGTSVYVGGEFAATVDFDPGPGMASLTSAGAADAYMLKLNGATGAYQWGSRWGATSTDAVYDMALRNGCDPLGAGTYSGTVDFDPGPGTFNVTGFGGFDIFLLKLRGDTGTL
ncbi:MAG TPA: hypothetical protein VEI97_21210 [bacterium]|nr:hypothetical protein [bacterium]